jgi:hypothetical protein
MLFFTFVGTYGSGQPASYFAIGNAVQIAAVSGIFGVTMHRRPVGTAVSVRHRPIARRCSWGARLFTSSTDAGCAHRLAVGRVAAGRRSVAPMAALDADDSDHDVAMSGLLLGCVSLITLNVMFINNFVYYALLIFSGANVAIDKLPDWMQAVSQALPLTRGIAASRALMGGAGGGGPLIGSLCSA